MTAPRFELTSQRQKVLRMPTELPGRACRKDVCREDACSRRTLSWCDRLCSTLHQITLDYTRLQYRNDGRVSCRIMGYYWTPKEALCFVSQPHTLERLQRLQRSRLCARLLGLVETENTCVKRFHFSQHPPAY